MAKTITIPKSFGYPTADFIINHKRYTLETGVPITVDDAIAEVVENAIALQPKEDENAGASGGGSSKNWYHKTGNPETLVSLDFKNLDVGLYVVDLYSAGTDGFYINKAYGASNPVLGNAYQAKLMIQVGINDGNKYVSVLNSFSSGSTQKLRPVSYVNELYVFTYDSSAVVDVYYSIEKVGV